MREQGDKPELGVRTVVYATDFSHCSENAGNYARLLALQLRTKLFVVHAFILSQAALEVEFEGKLRRSKQRIDLQAILGQKALALSSSSLEVVPVLLEGDPHLAIPEFAEKHGPSLIVLGTHGGGRVARGLIGSVAEKILRSTRWPSLTVGPQAASVSSTSLALPFNRSIDLLVLGIRKTSHLGLEMRASGAFRIIVDASCPVLTITG